MADPDDGSLDPAPCPDQSAPPVADQQRLWTPWRMRYVGGGTAEEGCLFCNRLASDDDLTSLILHRGERSFAIMNLFPYNTGHLMLVPNEHVASPEAMDLAAAAEMTALLPPTLRALRRVLRCAGFNIGMNVGDVAGAGVADHLHQHVVPRWVGDANFMPILASTMVLPELIPVTYAKVRAELARELEHESAVASVALGADDGAVLVGGDGRLPVATAAPDEPLWRSARRVVDALTGGKAEVVGWAGAARSDRGPIALTLRVLGVDGGGSAVTGGFRWLPVDEAAAGLDGELVALALANLAPSVGGG